MENNVVQVNSGSNGNSVVIYRFDVFKGKMGEDGRIEKVRSLGAAYLREGLRTYTVHLKTLLGVTYYLLQNTRTLSPDFVIMAREPSKNGNRKYMWSVIGEGRILDALNSNIMQLQWDLFGDNVYMTLSPEKVSHVESAQLAA